MVSKKILITGASGYIGKELSRYLLKKGCELNLLTRYEVKIPLDLLNNKKVNVFIGSLESRKVLEKAIKGVNAVFHLAACLNTFEKRNRLFETNEAGLNNILSECKKTSRSIRFVFASSIDVGKRQSDYAKSKLKGEEIVKMYLSNSKISYTIVRIGNVYKEKESGVIKGVEDILNKGNWQSSVLYYLLGDKHLYLIEMKNLVRKLAKIINDSSVKNQTIFFVDKILTIGEIIKQKKVNPLPKHFLWNIILLKIWLILGKIFKRADLLIYLSLEK